MGAMYVITSGSRPFRSISTQGCKAFSGLSPFAQALMRALYVMMWAQASLLHINTTEFHVILGLVVLLAGTDFALFASTNKGGVCDHIGLLASLLHMGGVGILGSFVGTQPRSQHHV